MGATTAAPAFASQIPVSPQLTSIHREPPRRPAGKAPWDAAPSALVAEHRCQDGTRAGSNRPATRKAFAPLRFIPSRQIPPWTYAQIPKELKATRELATARRSLPTAASHSGLLTPKKPRVTPAPPPRAARQERGATPPPPPAAPRPGGRPGSPPTSPGGGPPDPERLRTQGRLPLRPAGGERPAWLPPPGPFTREAAPTATGCARAPGPRRLAPAPPASGGPSGATPPPHAPPAAASAPASSASRRHFRANVTVPVTAFGSGGGAARGGRRQTARIGPAALAGGGQLTRGGGGWSARLPDTGPAPRSAHRSAAQRGRGGPLRARGWPRRWRRRCPSEDGATCQRLFALRGGSAAPPAV